VRFEICSPSFHCSFAVSVSPAFDEQFNDQRRPPSSSSMGRRATPSLPFVFLRHEFTHLSDMLDPAFGYEPDTGRPKHPSQERLIRERYRLLWDITIDGRLATRGQPPCAARDQHWTQFKRAYGFWEASTLEQTFDSLWSEKQPRHARLLELASDPRGLRFAHKPSPGALCPLCGFPTFHWIPEEQITTPVLEAVATEFPEWTPEQGICNRCCEVYQAARPDHAACT
jgi:hypothetical protein